MNRWAGTVFVLLLAGAGPLLAPPAVRDAGLWPDFAVLAVVFLGFRGTPDRAALLGVVAGLVAGLWAPEPLCFRPFILGCVGYLAGLVASVVHRDQLLARVVCAVLGVLVVRGAENVAALLATSGGGAWTSEQAGRVLWATVSAAGVAAVVSPVWFAAARRWRLLAPLERTFRDAGSR